MRLRPSHLPFLLLALASLPAGAYELLQKLSERRQSNHGLLAISARAEAETPWRPRTGRWLLDHTEHELRETSHFYALLGDELVTPTPQRRGPLRIPALSNSSNGSSSSRAR